MDRMNRDCKSLGYLIYINDTESIFLENLDL